MDMFTNPFKRAFSSGYSASSVIHTARGTLEAFGDGSVYWNGRRIDQPHSCQKTSTLVVAVREKDTGEFKEVPLVPSANGTYVIEITGGVNDFSLNLSDGCFMGNIEIKIAGSVGGQVIAHSGNVSVAGPVQGSVSSRTGSVQVKGDVKQDVINTSGSNEIDGSVDGNVRTISGSVSIGSNVDGSVQTTSGDIDVHGSVNGSAMSLRRNFGLKGRRALRRRASLFQGFCKKRYRSDESSTSCDSSSSSDSD